jgi:hypothetical protein
MPSSAPCSQTPPVCVGPKNAVIWDVSTAITNTNVFRGIAPCGCSQNRRFGEYAASVFGVRLHSYVAVKSQLIMLPIKEFDIGPKIARIINTDSTAIQLWSSIILKMEALCASETSVKTRATQ